MDKGQVLMRKHHTIGHSCGREYLSPGSSCRTYTGNSRPGGTSIVVSASAYIGVGVNDRYPLDRIDGWSGRFRGSPILLYHLPRS